MKNSKLTLSKKTVSSLSDSKNFKSNKFITIPSGGSTVISGF